MKKYYEIFKIIEKYISNEYPFWCEHDILGFNIDPEEVTEEDKIKLDNYGVFYDRDYDSYIKFV